MNDSAPRRLSIAIAEDDASYRKILRVLLEEQLGHHVVCEAENGAALLQACDGLEFDLLIVDFEMPLLDGLATAEQMTKRRSVPIILLSGHADLQHVVVEQEPISLCLPKPVAVESLRTAIASLFN